MAVMIRRGESYQLSVGTWLQTFNASFSAAFTRSMFREAEISIPAFGFSTHRYLNGLHCTMLSWNVNMNMNTDVSVIESEFLRVYIGP